MFDEIVLTDQFVDSYLQIVVEDLPLPNMDQIARYTALIIQRDIKIIALEEAVNKAHLIELIDTLKEITNFVFLKEPCGYYCDEAVGHVDHKYTNWLRQIILDLNELSSHAHAAMKIKVDGL